MTRKKVLDNLKIEWVEDWVNTTLQSERIFINPIDLEYWILYCRWSYNDPWIYGICCFADDEVSYYLGSGLLSCDKREEVQKYAISLLKEFIIPSSPFDSFEETVKYYKCIT